MPLVTSLLTAIVRADGDALVLHAGERPYVVAPTGQLELASRALTLDAVKGMLNELLSLRGASGAGRDWRGAARSPAGCLGQTFACTRVRRPSAVVSAAARSASRHLDSSSAPSSQRPNRRCSRSGQCRNLSPNHSGRARGSRAIASRNRVRSGHLHCQLQPELEPEPALELEPELESGTGTGTRTGTGTGTGTSPESGTYLEQFEDVCRRFFAGPPVERASRIARAGNPRHRWNTSRRCPRDLVRHQPSSADLYGRCSASEPALVDAARRNRNLAPRSCFLFRANQVRGDQSGALHAIAPRDGHRSPAPHRRRARRVDAVSHVAGSPVHSRRRRDQRRSRARAPMSEADVEALIST